MALSAAERQRAYRERQKERQGAVASPTVTQRRDGHRVMRDDVTFVRDDCDAVVALLEALPRVRATHEGDYTYQDRARDFVAVFNGTSSAEQGRRVLSQISQICDPAPILSDADKPGTLAMKSGMRRVMAEIMLCMVPREQVKIERE